MKIEFENRSRSTRSGFAHDTKVYIDGQFEISTSAHYLNRTWESYAFQSVMKQALHLLIDAEKEQLKAEYKQQTGRKRISKDMTFTNERIELLTKKRQEL
jgi:hypothetical protein